MTHHAEDSSVPQVPTLGWRHDIPEEPIRSPDQLVRRLDEIAADHADEPPLVGLYMPDGSSVAIGLGRDHSVVSYIRDVDEPDYLSRGSDENDEPLLFYYDGAQSEFPPNAAVSVEDAYEAMRRFLATGQRPDNIDWQQ